MFFLNCYLPKSLPVGEAPGTPQGTGTGRGSVAGEGRLAGIPYSAALYPHYDEKKDIQSNIASCLKEFQKMKSKVTSKGKRLYLIVYLQSLYGQLL